MKPWLLLALCFTLPAHAASGSKISLPPLKYPIVLVHGATMKGSSLDIGFLHYGEYFRNLTSFLGSAGTPVKVVELTTDSSIGERGAVLKNFLETDMKGQKVNLIAHSLGGLDARYAISILGASKYVASLTTIGTPHHGTPLADWGVRQKEQRTLWYWFFRLLGYDIAQRRFLPELTTEAMEKRFNPKVPNASGVKYFSAKSRASFARSSMSYLLWFTAHWVESEQNPILAHGQDGLVPFDSQAWGEVVSEAEDLDHLGQINHHEWRSRDESETALRVYADIYARLVKEGL